MHLNRLFFAVVCLISVSHMYGQHNNVLQAGVGITHTAFIDEQASPLLYHHNGPTLQIGYNRHTSNGIWIFALHGGLGGLRPAGTDDRYWYSTNNNEGVISDSMALKGTFYHAQLKAGYLHQIYDGEKGKTYIGGSAGNTVYYSDNIVRAGWFNATAANFEMQQTYQPAEKHFLRCALTIPILARTTRLPWHNTISAPGGEGNIHTLFSGSWLGWPGNYMQADISLQYQFAVNDNIALGAQYRGTWMQYSKELPIRLLQHNGTGYIQFHF